MYQYSRCGVFTVFLKNGYELVDTNYGKGVTIHNLESLHEAIGRAIVESTSPMNGAEFRFLRLELGLTQEGLGLIVGKDAQAIARCEKGVNKRVDPSIDRILRVVYRERFKQTGAIEELLRNVKSTPPVQRKFIARESKSTWTAKAVA
jgi:putative transcriptional regulator